MVSGRFAADLVAMLAIVAALLLGAAARRAHRGPHADGRRGARALRRRARLAGGARARGRRAPRRAPRDPRPASRMSRPTPCRWATTLLVRPGELLPCDAVVLEAARTWMPRGSPVSRCRSRATAGVRLLSGSLNLDGPAHRSRHGPGQREPVRPHRRARAHGAGEQVAAAAAGRPLRRLVHAAHAAGLPRRLPAHPRSGPRAGGAGGRDAVPADPRDAGRHRGRHQQRRPPRDHLPPRLGARAARTHHHGGLRQDRHADDRPAARSRAVLASPPFAPEPMCFGWRAGSSTAPATCSLERSSKEAVARGVALPQAPGDHRGTRRRA